MDDANMKFQIANPYPGQISDEQWMQWVLSNTNTPEQQFRFPRGIQHIGKQAEFGPSPMPKVDLSPMAKMPQIDPAAMAPQGGNPMRPGAVPQIGPPIGMMPNQGQMANVGGQPMQPAPLDSGGGVGGLLSALSGGQGGQSSLPKSLGLLAFGANMMNNTNPRNHLLPYGFGQKLGDSLGAGMGTYANLNKIMNPARPTGFDLVEVKEGPNIVTYKKHKNGRMERVSESPRSMGKDGDKGFTLGPNQVRFDEKGRRIAEGNKKADTAAGSSLSKLIAERNALPEGDPLRATYDAAIKKASEGKPLATATANIEQEKGEDKKYGEGLAGEHLEIRKSAYNARKRKMSNRAMRGIPFNSGAGSSWMVKGAAVVRSLFPDRFTPDELKQFLGNAQQFQSITMDGLLNKLATQKGPQTEGDAERAHKTLANIDNEVQANAFILDFSDAIADSEIELGKFVNGYKKKHGTVDGWATAWAESPSGLKSVYEYPSMKKWAERAKSTQLNQFKYLGEAQ